MSINIYFRFNAYYSSAGTVSLKFKYEPTIMTFDSAGKREIRPEAYNWDRFKKE